MPRSVQTDTLFRGQMSPAAARQFVRERTRRLVTEEIASLHEHSRLLRNSVGDTRMRVPECANRDAANHVEITRSAIVE